MQSTQTFIAPSMVSARTPILNDLMKIYLPPRAPFIEPAFYFAQHDTETAYFRVIDYLLDNGAVLAGPVVIGDMGDPDGMSNLDWSHAEEITVRSREELAAVRQTTGRVIVEATLSNVGPGSSGRDVRVAVLSISESSIGYDHHPIAIWCDGLAFEPYVSSSVKERASKEILELFRSAVKNLSPSYGTLLMSCPLPSPHGVAERPDGFEFDDCYVSGDYVGHSTLDKIRQVIDEDHRLDFHQGLLVLASGFLTSAPVKNEGVAELVARAIVKKSGEADDG